MSLAQRFERRLEGMVGSAFARVFKGQVEPVEIGNALQREAVDKKSVMGNGQVLAPNRYRVTLGDSDYERLEPWSVQLTQSLAELLQEFLDDQALQTIGDVEVLLAHDAALHTGVFGVASRMESQAAPRRRPFDSMSVPVVPGRPDEYLQPFSAPAAPVPAPAPPMPAPSFEAPSAFPGGYQQDYPQPAYAQQPPPQQPPPPQRPPAPRAQLIIDGTNRALSLRAGGNVLGRGSESDVQLLDQGVSRRHAEIVLADGQALVRDLDSTNGTSVNGHDIRSQTLQHGDVIRVGHTRLVYQLLGPGPS